MSGMCYWVTGLSATGKTTLSVLLANHLRDSSLKVILLDGDELRNVFHSNSNTREDRVARGFKFSGLCKLLVNQDVDVVIAVIGLFKELHEWNRENISNYIEIFIDTPLEELKRRDPKNLYRDFDSGKIKNMAGLNIKVDYPLKPDVHLKWSNEKDVNIMFNELLNKLNNNIIYKQQLEQ
jgi:adenylylsulfate kinase